MNLDANNTSTISNKAKSNQNPSTVTINSQKSSTVVPPSMGQVAERQQHQLMNQQQFVQQQQQSYTQQQVNESNTSSNFLSQGNSNSVASSRANQQSDPFSSYQQSTMLNRNM